VSLPASNELIIKKPAATKNAEQILTRVYDMYQYKFSKIGKK